MTKKQRSLLFISMLFVFFLVGPTVIFYSQGYRIDFDSRKIVQTGAFYFRTVPRNSTIEIRPEFEEKTTTKSTDFFFGTAFIENLLPKKYFVTIEKSGYHSWRKLLEIHEKTVTELKNITLVLENPSFDILEEKIEDFFYFPSIDRFILKKENSENTWLLSLYNYRNNSTVSLFSYSKDDILEILGLNNQGEQFLIRVEKENLFEYYLLNMDGSSFIPINLPVEISNVSFHPNKKEEVIFFKDNNLFFYNYEKKETGLLIENVLDGKLRGDGSFFWLSIDGDLFRNIENSQKVNRIPIEIKDNKRYEIFFPNSSEVMIKEENIFYLLNRKTLNFEEKFESQYEPLTSPDFQKIAYYTDYEIGILFLEDVIDQPQRVYGERVFLTRFSEKIDNLNWYTAHYLVFTISDRIKVMETDNRDNINIVLLVERNQPKIFFNYYNKRLYLLSEKKLLVSEKLVP